MILLLAQKLILMNVEVKMNLKMIKKTIYLLILILSISGCRTGKRVNENLIGDWNIFYLIFNGENLLNNYDNNSFMTGYFKIMEDGYFIIDNLEGYKINGTILYEDGIILKIINSSEPRLEGSYKIKLEFEHKNKTKMTIMSENTEIYAEKRNIDFSKIQ